MMITLLPNHDLSRNKDTVITIYVDKNMSEQLRDGAIGLYADDAAASFDNVYIKSLR